MKNLPKLGMAAVALAGAVIAWGVPAVALSERGVNAYFDELERQFLGGDAEAYCARLHEDLVVAVTDASAVAPVRIAGGRDEWCAHVANAAKGIDLLGLETEAVRRDVHIRRHWLAPWTAEVTYEERRVSTMKRIHQSLKTRSSDRWILVLTPGGVKARRLESNVVRDE